MNFDILIVGGGMAAAHAIKELVKAKPDMRIGLVGEENEPPYDRPPLSKGYLLGKVPRDSLFLLKNNFFGDNRIGEVLGRKAVAVNAERHFVTTDDGYDIGYDKLLIASGCRARQLPCPGADTNGLYYLRTLKDAETLREVALKAKQAVIIGGGFIGIEVASVLAEMGLGVTVIHRGDRLFDKFGSEDFSSFYGELFDDRGVHVIYNDEAAEIYGDDEVEGVVTAAGRTLPCDIAIAGIGVYPDTSYLQGSGLELGNGVIVDEHLRASHPDVYAAGDVANFNDLVYGRRRRIEHWDNAIRQGKLAARNLAGANESFFNVSYFYSTVFGLTFECFGDMSEYDEIIVRGTFENNSVAVFYIKSGVMQSAILQKRPAQERQVVRQLISERTPLDSVQDKLADEEFELKKALAA